MQTSPLIVFDSGIGGLSILRYLRNLSIPILYYADQANFPYGNKTAQWVEDRILELGGIFAKQNPIGVMLACNTATVSAIDILRTRLDCPVYGVEPVVKMIAHHHSPIIWGTKLTLSSEKAANLLRNHGQHVRYYTPPNLPQAIEDDEVDSIERALTIAQKECGNPDAIGLSCTHYPLVIDQIKKYFPNSELYDPSQSVSAHIQQSLALSTDSMQPGSIEYYSTKDVLRLKKLADKYL